MFNHLEDSTFPMYNWNRQCPSHLILNQSNSTEQGSRICKSRKWRGRRSVNRIQFEPNILNLPSFFSESGNKQNWMKKDHLNMVVCYCDWLRLIKRPKKRKRNRGCVLLHTFNISNPNSELSNNYRQLQAESISERFTVQCLIKLDHWLILTCKWATIDSK